MIVCLNGEFVPEEQARVSVFDRGFLYGDGLFETLRIVQGEPFRWQDHFERLDDGATILNLHLPWNGGELGGLAKKLAALNARPDAMLRLTVSRGVGQRGYSPKGAARPTLVMALHPAPVIDRLAPAQWRLHTASYRVAAGDPLSRVKSTSKLIHVLARAEAEVHGAQEALLLNTGGEVAEGASSNVFWIDQGMVCTTPLASGALPGITRRQVLKQCEGAGWPAAERAISPDDLFRAEGVFLTFSSLGIVEVVSLDHRPLRRSGRTIELHRAYQALFPVSASS